MNEKSKKERLVILDDNIAYLRSLRRVLREDYHVVIASSPDEFYKQLDPRPHMILLDVRLDEKDPKNRQGIEVLQIIKEEYPGVNVVMMSAYADIDMAVEAMREGAIDFIQKSQMADIRELRRFLKGVTERASLTQRVVQLEHDLNRLEPWEIVGDSRLIQETKAMIDNVAEDGIVTVLLRGETGTGKELAARSIWRRGRRSAGPFVPVALPSLSPSIIESELFGHEAGAFTDARTRRLGHIEAANGGLLFLDEIGDLPGQIQAKLVRFLEDRTVTRVGGNKPVPVDVQIVAATNKDLESSVQDGTFRHDLYFRFKTFQITLPPLRQRKDDILPIAAYFLGLFRQQGRTSITNFSSTALGHMQNYSWPGNVRELRSSIERAIILANLKRRREIQVADLPLEISSINQPESFPISDTNQDSICLAEQLAIAELSYIEWAMKRADGKKTDAWKLLGLNDRFALTRRVNTLQRRYPHLLQRFPLILQHWEPT